jgi:hypothetical protein
MAVLAAHVEVGAEFSNEEAIQMMDANASVLNTEQGGKRIWDYYRGKHTRGLEGHGNIERV